MIRQTHFRPYKGKIKKHRTFIMSAAAVLLGSLAAPVLAEDKAPAQNGPAVSQTSETVSEATSADSSNSDSMTDSTSGQTTVSEQASESQASSAFQEDSQNQTTATTAETTATGSETQHPSAAGTNQVSQEHTSASSQPQTAEKTKQTSAETRGFVTRDDGKTYYINQEGQKLTGFQTIDGKTYYFSADGSLQKDRLITVNNDVYYIDSQGQPAVSQFINKAGSFYYLDEDGKALTGWQTIDGKQLYFAEKNRPRTAAQYKGSMYTIDGDKYYFDKDSGELWTNRFVYYIGNWYYLDSQGRAVTGYQTIDQQPYYFDNDGKQLKGIGYDKDGQLILTDYNSGVILKQKIENKKFYQKNNNWYYLDENNQFATGWQTINGQKLYFNSDGSQVKGKMISLDGKKYYFDPDSGEMWTNRFVSQSQYNERYSSYFNVWYYLGADGAAVTGKQTIDGKQLYFYSDSWQAKNQLIRKNNKFYYFDPDSGEMWTNRFVYITPSNNYYYQPYYKGWLYLGADGAAVTGWQTIDGKVLYFLPSYDSKLGYYYQEAGQIKDKLLEIDGSLYYFDPDTGEMWTNRTLTYRGNTYQIGADGKAVLQQP
ncbi:hypothetical protein [Streptococcus orisasini]|uniref:hypothetical protein n=1 Tax=Streptococcus orisasini TaxID=1080071 RepID=UPI00071040FF|nr:hypothetical protein [Streptococcus orisasini]